MSTPLGQLIREKRESLSAIAERAGLPLPTVSKLANAELTTMPRRETLIALAKGLECPVEIVNRAAAATAGYVLQTDRGDDPQTEVIIAGLAEITPEQRKQIAALLHAMRRPSSLQ